MKIFNIDRGHMGSVTIIANNREDLADIIEKNNKQQSYPFIIDYNANDFSEHEIEHGRIFHNLGDI